MFDSTEAKFFIGSSAEGLRATEALQFKLVHYCFPQIWSLLFGNVSGVSKLESDISKLERVEPAAARFASLTTFGVPRRGCARLRFRDAVGAIVDALACMTQAALLESRAQRTRMAG